ncbi:MAG: type II/IV secretion system ATPase subunit [Candidatus Aenigmatarchaeota archaeon]
MRPKHAETGSSTNYKMGNGADIKIGTIVAKKSVPTPMTATTVTKPLPAAAPKMKIRIGEKREEAKAKEMIVEEEIPSFTKFAEPKIKNEHIKVRLKSPMEKITENTNVTGMKIPNVEDIRTGTISSPSQIIIAGNGMSGLGELFQKHEKRIVDGFTIPDIKNIETFKITQFPEQELRTTEMKYPLTPRNPGKNERVFAYAHIYWDFNVNQLVYDIIEPTINSEDHVKIEEMKEYIQEKLDINFAAVRKKEALDYIVKLFDQAIEYFDLPLGEKKEIYRYYVIRDFIGLGKIDALMNDEFIEDISCDGIEIPMYVYHRNPKFGSLRTNVIFKDKNELDGFVMKLAERCGKTISVAKPLLDGTLPDGSRVQSTLGSDIARLGSNFTIRRFTEMPLTPVDLIKLGTVDIKMMAFFWMCVDYGTSILVSGGTATGKTSMLNVLSLFIRPQMKIVSIEDTAELRLPHPHWIPEVARAPIEAKGEIDMYELLRESLRQRPDYIIVGEVRGREAYVLFQQIAIGHPGLSTIHAESLNKLVDRLTTEPISLPPNLIQNLDLIVFLRRVRAAGRSFRKVQDVYEIAGFDRESKMPITNDIFKWNPVSDEFEIASKSALLKKIATALAMDEDKMENEIENRAKVLEWMVKRDIKDYKEIGKIINLYYASPEYLMQRLGG